ncbi:alpha/beta fold hydrolase [Streptomyces sp. AM 4-1-1]|uniref:thioesterase domain-containing protein n=1 Tax=unclassified Streptomyces TaxID=2593676 RepID=UPI0023B8F0D9|nr:alpha/beta fold hydrolase [Streptomyces sp. AM 4-1-1]WEH37228.1 alpha/beta fold hydrolase [Streptomyces sp. AM 4-1-1]
MSEETATHLLSTYGRPQDFSSVVLHPSGGGLGQYVGLIAALSRRGAVHGIRASGLRTGELPDERVADMTDRYLPVLRSLPNRPDLLVGWSLGGVLAWELAVALATDDYRPAVVMLDSFAEPWSACADDPGRQAVLRKIVEEAAPAADQEGRDRVLRTATAHIAASVGHQVKSRYEGPVLLMPGNSAERTRQISDWSARAPFLRTSPLDCGHFEIFERENLRGLLRNLENFLLHS